MEDFKDVVMTTWKYNLIESIRKDVPISKETIREMFNVIDGQISEAYKSGQFDGKRSGELNVTTS